MLKYRWPIFLSIVTFLTALVVLRDIQLPIRPALTFLFLLFCPGMAFVKLVEIENKYIEFTIAATLSITLGQLVSMAVLYLDIWSVHTNIFILCMVSFTGVFFQLLKFRSPVPI